ncbi:putative metallocarboxypeptidase ecm14 [Orbilia brochopaga]|uniref:Inactive metallocarboxypeptidase ECM14 n=1 Tax=Orbilia brochopaga TaxID=3140254 RepID=A0AAV9UJF9_9PEZI
MRSIIVYCAVAAQICSTAVSSTIPAGSESGVRLPLNDDENRSESVADISDIFASPARDSRNAWSRLRNKLVVKIFGGKERHGSTNHQHASAGQKPLGDNNSNKVSSFSRYQNEVVLRFNISTIDEAAALAEAAEVLFLDVWSATKDYADIRVDKDVVQSLLGLLPESMQQSHSPLMHDLASTIRETFPGFSKANPLGSPIGSSSKYRLSGSQDFFSDYQPYNVINPWMKQLASLFPAHVSTFTVGQSYEGRDINGIKVSSPEPRPHRRKAIIVSGGSHAREWIAASTVCWVANTWANNYQMASSDSQTTSGDPELSKLIERFDWYFIPTINVDGYVYSMAQDGDRLWRKNRQPTSVSFCKGVELDRSYAFQWGQQSHHNPCSENYPGEKQFDAAESKSFAAWAKNLTKVDGGDSHIIGFMDLHSYSQQILYPYSYTCEERPPDLENLMEAALNMAKAIRMRHGEQYEISSACEGGHYRVADKTKQKQAGKRDFQLTETGGGGSALDYFYGQLKAPYAFQVKLRDRGSYGFLLPKEYIPPTGEEIADMVKMFGMFLINDE